MAASAQQIVMCVSVAILLVTPCYNASRSLRPRGTRGLLPSTRVWEDDPEVPRNDIDEEVPTSALEIDMELNQWTRFQAQEILQDYNSPEANPDPSNPSPGLGN